MLQKHTGNMPTGCRGKKIAVDIARGLACLHQASVIHFDIKRWELGFECKARYVLIIHADHLQSRTCPTHMALNCSPYHHSAIVAPAGFAAFCDSCDWYARSQVKASRRDFRAGTTSRRWKPTVVSLFAPGNKAHEMGIPVVDGNLLDQKRLQLDGDGHRQTKEIGACRSDGTRGYRWNTKTEGHASPWAGNWNAGCQ